MPSIYGYTTRSVELTEEELNLYEPGNVVTWLQWNSSTIGKNFSIYFGSRNTLFIIYSNSSRDISNFYPYSAEKIALYSPFSHFLIFKKEESKGKYKIYMRQIKIKK